MDGREEDRRAAGAPGARARVRALRWLGGLARPHARSLAVAALALVLSGGVALVVPAVAGRVVDAAIVERSLAQLRVVLLGMLGLFAVSAALDFLETYLLRATAARLLRGLRERLHGHLMDLSPSFFERERVGELLSRLNSDVSAIGDVLTRALTGGLQQSLVLVGALAILAVMHTKLTGVMLLAVPPVVVVAVLYGIRFERLSKERQELTADANVAAEESLAGIRTVQAFGREGEERARYRERQARVLTLALRIARIWGGFNALTTFFAFAALTLVLWYGGTLVVRGELTPGQLTAFLIYTIQVAGAVGAITSVYGGLASAAGATERVRELLATAPAIADAPDALPLARPRGEVAFRDVRFAYPGQPDRPAIDGVSLRIAPGEVVALAGPSGGGKSTLVALLLRFHDPQEGSVTADGLDVRHLRLADLRAAIGLVPQDIFLFGGTVAENIRYGDPRATDDDVRRAAEAARAADFVERLPQGYDTPLGERGVRLSAGERQRISIARVLLKDPAIVVLDEATSSLDAESEHRVQEALERLFEGRTTLVIAHRLATVRRADRVVLLDAGRIAEQGTHAELLARDGTYRRLCELQMMAPEAAGARDEPPASVG